MSVFNGPVQVLRGFCHFLLIEKYLDKNCFVSKNPYGESSFKARRCFRLLYIIEIGRYSLKCCFTVGLITEEASVEPAVALLIRALNVDPAYVDYIAA